MSAVSINSAQPKLTYERLLGKDITRLPDVRKVSRDIFIHTKEPLSIEARKNRFWKQVLTMGTCAVVALGLAHRNNLFNPVRREAKKILRDEQLQQKVLTFVDKKLSTQMYYNATKKHLINIINDENRAAEFVTETKKVLKDKALFKKLFEKVKKRLADDTNPETLRQGFAVDVLDRLFIKIEKDLAKNKENSLPFKNQGEKIIKDIFITPRNGQSTIEDILISSINNRTSSTIEGFINKLVVNTRLGI